MTNKEAINLLVNAEYADKWQGNNDLQTALHRALDALDRVNYLEDCICKALDALDRGNDNDWARKALEEAVDA